jgi:hypothetical protein
VDRGGGSWEIYAGLGGITHFSSLAGGHERIQLQRTAASELHMQATSAETQAPVAPRKLTEAETLALYEQRYQARLKAEKEARRGGAKQRGPAVTLGGVPLALQELLDDAMPVSMPTAQQQPSRQTHKTPAATATRVATTGLHTIYSPVTDPGQSNPSPKQRLAATVAGQVAVSDWIARTPPLCLTATSSTGPRQSRRSCLCD